MMKLIALSLLAVTFASCSNSTSSSGTPTVAQFIAQDSNFTNFQAWVQNGAPRQGMDPTGLLGMGAHGGPDSSVTRRVYMNSSSPERGANGQFPVGTIFVKTSAMTSNPNSISMVTAMAKRGGGYDSTGHGWEFFMLSPMNGSIMARGDTLMGGMCKGCHAAGKDDVFTR